MFEITNVAVVFLIDVEIRFCDVLEPVLILIIINDLNYLLFSFPHVRWR